MFTFKIVFNQNELENKSPVIRLPVQQKHTADMRNFDFKLQSYCKIVG